MAARPKLETIVEKGTAEHPEIELKPEEEIDYDDAPVVPEEWDMMSGDQQSDAESAYMKQTYQDYLDSEIENWYSENSEDDARSVVAERFTEGTESDWAATAIADWITNYEDDKGKPFPFTAENLVEALTVSHDTGNYPAEKGTDIDFDDSKLMPKNYDPSPTLPGIKPPDPSDFLTSADRKSLLRDITDAFDKEWDRVRDHMDPPDYLGDSVKEFQEESWSSMDDKDKFSWAESHTDIIKDAQAEYDKWLDEQGDKEGETATLDRPATYDPLESGSSRANYKATQALARYLSEKRAAQLIVDRGLAKDEQQIYGRVRQIDRGLWDGWKGSSSSLEGHVLQLATAEELGGRFRDAGMERDKIIEYADKAYPSIGGYKGVKAYVRAKWETAQFMLDKAGVHSVSVYRGIDMRRTPTTNAQLEDAIKNKVQRPSGYTALPTLDIKRNGAQSSSTDRNVSNKWDGSDRVVLRIEAPRTAVISVPAYGINVHSEHEVVVAGTAWKAWDAWWHEAPTFENVPVTQHTGATP